MIRGDIVVVDYHKGNLQSVVRGLGAAGGSAYVSDDPSDIRRSQGIILPGVGSFEEASSCPAWAASRMRSRI